VEFSTSIDRFAILHALISGQFRHQLKRFLFRQDCVQAPPQLDCFRP